MEKKKHFADLIAVFGENNNSGFGSNVIIGEISPGNDIENIGLSCYKNFLGSKWNNDTEKMWLSPRKKVYENQGKIQDNFIDVLSSITDQQAKISIPLLTELIQNAEEGRKAINKVFGSPDILKTIVYTIGDGDAYSGIMVTAVFTSGEYCSLMAIMD